MAYGFSCLNSSGYVQIDDSYSNYSLIAEGGASGGSAVFYPTGYTYPLILVKLAAGTGTRFVTGGDGTFTSSAPCSYRVYAKTSEVTQSGAYGLNVMNSTGTVANFSSNNTGLRVYSVGYTNNSTTSYSLPSPGFIAYLLLNPLSLCNIAQISPNQGINQTLIATQNADGSASWTVATFSAGPPFNSGLFLGTRTMLIGE